MRIFSDQSRLNEEIIQTENFSNMFNESEFKRNLRD